MSERVSTHEDGVAAAAEAICAKDHRGSGCVICVQRATQALAAYTAKRSECGTCIDSPGSVQNPTALDEWDDCPDCTNRRLLLDLGSYEVVSAEQWGHAKATGKWSEVVTLDEAKAMFDGERHHPDKFHIKCLGSHIFSYKDADDWASQLLMWEGRGSHPDDIRVFIYNPPTPLFTLTTEEGSK